MDVETQHHKRNWYQRAAFLPGTFGLVTTWNSETRQAHVAPYQLIFPYNVSGERNSIMIHMRDNSETLTNMRACKPFSITYGEWTKRQIKVIAQLGNPFLGYTDEQRNALLADVGMGVLDDGLEPLRPAGGFQTIDVMYDSDTSPGPGQATAIAEIFRIKVNTEYADALRGLGDFPQPPMTYGFRTETGFSFWQFGAQWDETGLVD